MESRFQPQRKISGCNWNGSISCTNNTINSETGGAKSCGISENCMLVIISNTLITVLLTIIITRIHAIKSNINATNPFAFRSPPRKEVFYSEWMCFIFRYIPCIARLYRYFYFWRNEIR